MQDALQRQIESKQDEMAELMGSVNDSFGGSGLQPPNSAKVRELGANLNFKIDRERGLQQKCAQSLKNKVMLTQLAVKLTEEISMLEEDIVG